MAREQDDWRLTWQQEDLQHAALAWQRYRVWSETWEHDHCAFCWDKFMDPDVSEEHRRFVDEHPDVRTEGYATTAEHPHGARCRWVCKPCFDDFADLFEWRVVAPD